MRDEQFSRRHPQFIDYIYVLSSCLAGWWQAWCFNYGRDSVLIPIVMSLPFALASYAHGAFLNRTSNVADRADWRRALVLWGGMPLSLVVGALTILAETGIMYGAGFGIVNLPFENLRLLIGEGAACLVWAICLWVWSRRPSLRSSRNSFFAIYAVLCAGVLSAAGLTELILRAFHKDLFIFLTSTIATTLSALILVFLRDKPLEIRGTDIPFRSLS